jgi:hypothetical protein
MEITAVVRSSPAGHEVEVRTDARTQALAIAPKPHGEGSSINATNIRYRARVSSPASESTIANLLRQTDAVAEVHNTVRAGAPVELVDW